MESYESYYLTSGLGFLGIAIFLIVAILRFSDKQRFIWLNLITLFYLAMASLISFQTAVDREWSWQTTRWFVWSGLTLVIIYSIAAFIQKLKKNQIWFWILINTTCIFISSLFVYGASMITP